MPDARPHRYSARHALRLGILGFVAIVTQSPAKAEQASNFGAQAQQTIHISVSVRPIIRVRGLTAAGYAQNGSDIASPSLCLWSNYEIEHLNIRAEWADGRSSDLGDVRQGSNSCSQLGRQVLQARMAPSSSGQADAGFVTLLVAPD